MGQARGMAARMDLQGLRERVECWRANRDGIRTRVPEELWTAAVAVARVEGVHATSKALRFNYYGLKDRLERAPSDVLDTLEEKPDTTPFVEIAMPSLSSFGSSNKDGTTIIECMGHRGDRMRIDVTGSRAVDIVGLAQAFWSREP